MDGMFGITLFNEEGNPTVQFFGTDPVKVLELMDGSMRNLSMLDAWNKHLGEEPTTEPAT